MTNDLRPRISVCTSVLNQSKYLQRMIESVQAQSFKNWELVLVDDGSTEDIKALVDNMADQRIKYHRFEQNKGIPHGMNWALEHSTGEFVQPLSADEWIDPFKFEQQLEYLDAHPEIGCVWGIPGTQAQGMGKRPEWEQHQHRAHNRSRYGWIRTLLRLEQVPIGGASMLMRRECYEAIGGFDPEIFYCSDLEWFIRFFQKFDGRVLPYRWADADQPDDRLTAPKPDTPEKFQADLKKVHAKHRMVLPPPEGRVTVGIPVRNMAKFIGKTMDSLLSQTTQEFDVLVLDDASADETPSLAEVLFPYKEKFGDRLKFMRFEENLGIQEAHNQMVARCENEFYITLAADDWISPTLIQKCLAQFKADPFLEFVATQTDFYNEKEELLPPGTHTLQSIPKAINKPREQWLAQLYYGNHYFGVGMYRTYALQEIGGFNKDDKFLCDYDVYLKLLQRENIYVIAEDLTHTRIHEGNISIGKFTQKFLKELYAKIKARYYPPRMKVIIATPFYEMRGFSPYISSLVNTVKMLTILGIDHEYWDASGDSYVDRAKNTLMNKFLEDPEATDLILIDSDMQWNADGLLTMLMLPEEVVMGSYPQKNAWGKWTALPELVKDETTENMHRPVGRFLPNGSALIKAQFVAGGFMRIKRGALEKFKAKHADLIYMDPSADPSDPERVYTEFSTCEVRDKMRWGEDRVFGRRLNEAGVEAWIYPNVNMGHYGVKGWHGNFDRFLRGHDKPSAEEQANTENFDAQKKAPQDHEGPPKIMY